MTHIDDMTGFDLDQLVAEKVMGWTLDSRSRIWQMPGRNPPNNRMLSAYPCAPQYEGCSNDYWRPSTNIAYAWDVVDHLAGATSHRVDIHDFGALPKWRCVIRLMGSTIVQTGEGETAPLAICRAALKAVGYTS